MKVRHFALVSVLALGLPAATLDAREQWGSRGVPPAYNEGYDRGLRAGTDDARRNERFEFTDEGDYRRADAGYRREYGRADWYQTEFRRGYQEGYRIGYQRNSYGRGGPYGGYDNYGRGGSAGSYGQYGRSGRNDVAFSNGYTDGFDEGYDDGRDRRRNDPFAESRYRNGDHDYRSEYGPRESYRLRYRDGFRQGYEDGYRDGGRGAARPWYR
jgi:hypothetical protein